MHDRLLQQLLTHSCKSSTVMKHAAVLTRRGKILAVHANQPGAHAETQVLRGRKKNKLQHVYVLRAESGTLKNSKPCRNCICSMRRHGVHAVTWSTGDAARPFTTELIASISNNWVSRADRACYT